MGNGSSVLGDLSGLARTTSGSRRGAGDGALGGSLVGGGVDNREKAGALDNRSRGGLGDSLNLGSGLSLGGLGLSLSAEASRGDGVNLREEVGLGEDRSGSLGGGILSEGEGRQDSQDKLREMHFVVELMDRVSECFQSV